MTSSSSFYVNSLSLSADPATEKIVVSAQKAVTRPTEGPASYETITFIDSIDAGYLIMFLSWTATFVLAWHHATATKRFFQ